MHSARRHEPGPLASSTIPSALVAAVAASFSATFADLWSTVSGDPTWDFGDGTPAAGGGTVEHTYAAPGAYTITTSAVDALGNQGAVMFSVNVAVCEALAGVEGLLCRCGNGLTIAACAGESLPAGLTKRFVAACGGVDAAQAAGAGRRGRKAAGRAVKGFKNARRALAAKAGRRLEAPCRDGLAALLATARENAVAFKSTL